METFISFLPATAVQEFLAEPNVKEKLRIGMKALAQSHKMEYSDEYFNDEEEPYIALRGYNIPTYSDVQMLVDYLNKLEPAFYVDAAEEWETICACYIPEDWRN